MKRPFFVKEIQPQAFDEAGFVDKKVVQYKVCAVYSIAFGRSNKGINSSLDSYWTLGKGSQIR